MPSSFFSRNVIRRSPFESPSTPWYERGKWPAWWIGHPNAPEKKSVVLGFRRKFSLPQAASFVVHVTADERYELFLDGVRVGIGSERGDRRNWFYESYEFTLPPGDHVLCARAWRLGPEGPSACAQISIRAGFLFAAEEPFGHLSTGEEGWECKILGGYNVCWPYSEIAFPGGRFEMDGRRLDWDFPEGASSEGWTHAVRLGQGRNADSVIECADDIWWLRPATLPAMVERLVSVGSVRHVQEITSLDTSDIPILASKTLLSEQTSWHDFIETDCQLTIPPHTGRRVLLDLEDYYCAYPEITVSSGEGSSIRIAWAEALYLDGQASKGNRSETEGKFFRGFSDLFRPEGGLFRTYTPLWWMAGRFVELVILTGSEPLILENLRLRVTHYPYNREADFVCSDESLNSLTPIFRKSLEMCSHETYMDCPYYEQLTYIGDTRLEALQAYTQTLDDRLTKKAIRLFDESRYSNGFTQARYPSRINQLIAPFSLWWIGMVHDFLYWRDDTVFVQERLPGVRAVLEAIRRHLNSDALIQSLPGWNFADWVPEWKDGIPPENAGGIHTLINLQAVLAFEQAADLERYCGDTVLAQRNEDTAQCLLDAVIKRFWDSAHGLIADDDSHKNFSEHTQSLALLTRGLDPRRSLSIAACLCAKGEERPQMVSTTIYFSHYLFEAYTKIGRSDCLLEKMKFWKELQQAGFKTTPESPEPSRSDCHGWGSHPLFHYFASILGIRPSAPKFATVQITPQLSHLAFVRGKMPHPLGTIEVNFQKAGGSLCGYVRLPLGLKGTLKFSGNSRQLGEGLTEL